MGTFLADMTGNVTERDVTVAPHRGDVMLSDDPSEPALDNSSVENATISNDEAMSLPHHINATDDATPASSVV